MSINLTEKFEFATDDLGSMEKVLNTIVGVMFSHQRVYFELPTESDLWDNGKKTDFPLPIYRLGRNLGSEQYATLKYGQTYHGHPTAEVDEIFTDFDLAGKANDKRKLEHKPTRMIIGGIKGKYPEGRTKTVLDADRCIAGCLSAFRTADKEAFLEYCGDGFCYGFNQFDGSIEMGYGIKKSFDCGSEMLQVYLTHIYYGK